MALSSQSILQTQTQSLKSHNPSLTLFKSKPESAKFATFNKPISAVHAAEPAKSPPAARGVRQERCSQFCEMELGELEDEEGIAVA
ncbi:unnamed protein product [Rhodiola kirilowii]